MEKKEESKNTTDIINKMLINMYPSKPCDIEIVRMFLGDNVTPQQLYDAFTKPAQVKEWSWTDPMPLVECHIDLKVGGAMRHVWKKRETGPVPAKDDDFSMGVLGKIIELNEPFCIVHTEIFDENWTGGETTITTIFSNEEIAKEVKGEKKEMDDKVATKSSTKTTSTTTVRTKLMLTICYSSKETRDRVIASPMTKGMAETYNKLDAFLLKKARAPA